MPSLCCFTIYWTTPMASNLKGRKYWKTWSMLFPFCWIFTKGKLLLITHQYLIQFSLFNTFTFLYFSLLLHLLHKYTLFKRLRLHSPHGTQLNNNSLSGLNLSTPINNSRRIRADQLTIWRYALQVADLLFPSNTSVAPGFVFVFCY